MMFPWTEPVNQATFYTLLVSKTFSMAKFDQIPFDLGGNWLLLGPLEMPWKYRSKQFFEKKWESYEFLAIGQTLNPKPKNSQNRDPFYEIEAQMDHQVS